MVLEIHDLYLYANKKHMQMKEPVHLIRSQTIDSKVTYFFLAAILQHRMYWYVAIQNAVELNNIPVCSLCFSVIEKSSIINVLWPFTPPIFI